MENSDQLQSQDVARKELQKAQLVATARPEEALDHLLRAEKLDPKNTNVLKLLGLSQLRLGQPVEAINTLERLLQMDPENQNALSAIAFGHRQLGHFDLARGRAEVALRCDAHDHTAREVLADCLVAGKDYLGGLRELNSLINVLKDQALARISFKAAYCYLQLGDHTRALEIASTLIENEYGDENVSAIYNRAQDLVRTEIEGKLKHMTWVQQVFNRFADKALLHLHLAGSRGIDSLREKYREVSNEAEAVRGLAARNERRAEEASRLAKTDHLTGLSNRASFDLDWKRRILENGSCAFVALDLDKFKLINDIHGHDGGDRALVKTAKIGAEIFKKPNSNFFRFGGEEFLAVVFDSPKSVLALAEKFRMTLETRASKELADEGLRLQWAGETGELGDRLLTASLGIAFWPHDTVDINEAMKLADEASYFAKEKGRNKVVVWTRQLLSKACK